MLWANCGLALPVNTAITAPSIVPPPPARKFGPEPRHPHTTRPAGRPTPPDPAAVPDLAVAGVEGFEPPNGAIKTRCLTAWRHPRAIVSGALAARARIGSAPATATGSGRASRTQSSAQAGARAP